jgi:MAF protein
MAARPDPGPRPAARLVLASSSHYRRELLARLRLSFVWAAPEVDETPAHGEDAEALVARLALAKARALAARFPDHLIIGADQVALCAAAIHGKPGNAAGAMAQLEAQSGRRVRLLTAVAVLDSGTGAGALECVPSELEFRQLTPAQIAAYVAAERPFDCAGSFKAEALGIALFERIECVDPTALMGLPLIALTRLLAAAGLDVLATASPGQSAARG